MADREPQRSLAEGILSEGGSRVIQSADKNDRTGTRSEVAMHARLITFNIGPGSRDVATALADEAYKQSVGMDGFVSATYMIFDEGAGDYGAITLWKSEANAEAAGNVLREWMLGKIGDKLTAPPVVRHGEVYEPS